MAVKKILVITPNIFKFHDSVGAVERPLIKALSKNVTPIILCANYGQTEYKKGFDEISELRPLKFCILIQRFLARIGLSELLYPDFAYWSWGRRALRSAKDIVKKKHISLIHSDSFPCSCHVIAYELKKKTGIPWLAQFYDPWYENPYRYLKHNCFKEKDKKWEKRVAENADLIILSSEPMRDMWIKRYGDIVASKIKVLPISANFESSILSKKDSGHFEIAHIGNSYFNRTVIPFFKALKDLLDDYPDLKDKVRMNMVGIATQEEKVFVVNNGLEQQVCFVGKMSETECKRYYEQADAFVAVDADNNGYNVFYPSKIIKYFYYRKPIIGITPDNSTMHSELTKTGHFVTNALDISGIKEYLLSLINADEDATTFDKEYWKRFVPDSVAKLYIEALNGIEHE